MWRSRGKCGKFPVNELLSVPPLAFRRHMKKMLDKKSQGILIIQSTWTCKMCKSMKKPLNYCNESHSTPGCNRAALKCLVKESHPHLLGGLDPER